VLVLVPGISDATVLIILAVSPLASQVLYTKAEKIKPDNLTPQQTHKTVPSIAEKPKTLGSVGFLVEIVVFGLVLGMFQTGNVLWVDEDLSVLLGHTLRIFLPLAVLFWINLSPRSERSEVWLRSILVLCALCLAVLLFLRGYIDVVIPAFTLAVRNFVALLIYMMLFRIVRDYDVHPVTILGIGRGLFNLALAMGFFLFGETPLSGYLASLSDTAFYLVMTCVLLLLFNSYSRVFTRILRGTPKEDVILKVTSIDDRCQAIAEIYSLTGRETEILKMTLKGRTKRYIAETLYLSEDTIRWYSKSIYRKLDIHSKQELLTLVGL
jgi:DNA-binding CsgD family transcriptional regulator